MAFPTDKLPVDLVLSHQVRMLDGRAPSVLFDVVVLDNRPPWLQGTLHGLIALRKAAGLAGARVHEVNYSLFNDSSFLRRFLEVSGGAHQPSAVARDASAGLNSVSVATLLELPASELDDFGLTAEYAASHFMGMASFVEQCRGAGSEAELCVYLDPDIFLHRRSSAEQGLIELAHRVFEANPTMVMLQPPTLCHVHMSAHEGEQCGVRAWHFWGTRHMIVHRARLLQLLPLRLHLHDFLWAATFEQVFTFAAARGRNLVGQMQCGHETFAIHTSSRFTAENLRRGNSERDVEVMPLEAHLDALCAEKGAGVGGAGNSLAAGTAELIERMEAARFAVPSARDFDFGAEAAWACGDALAATSCDDMVPSRSRIASGLAW